MSAKVHFDDQLPDFGTGWVVPACRKTGHRLEVTKKLRRLDRGPPNPLEFEGTTDSSKVTCKRCLHLLAKRTERLLNDKPLVVNASDVEIKIDGQVLRHLEKAVATFRPRRRA